MNYACDTPSRWVTGENLFEARSWHSPGFGSGEDGKEDIETRTLPANTSPNTSTWRGQGKARQDKGVGCNGWGVTGNGSAMFDRMKTRRRQQYTGADLGSLLARGRVIVSHAKRLFSCVRDVACGLGWSTDCRHETAENDPDLAPCATHTPEPAPSLMMTENHQAGKGFVHRRQLRAGHRSGNGLLPSNCVAQWLRLGGSFHSGKLIVVQITPYRFIGTQPQEKSSVVTSGKHGGVSLRHRSSGGLDRGQLCLPLTFTLDLRLRLSNHRAMIWTVDHIPERFHVMRVT